MDGTIKLGPRSKGNDVVDRRRQRMRNALLALYRLAAQLAHPLITLKHAPALHLARLAAMQPSPQVILRTVEPLGAPLRARAGVRLVMDEPVSAPFALTGIPALAEGVGTYPAGLGQQHPLRRTPPQHQIRARPAILAVWTPAGNWGFRLEWLHALFARTIPAPGRVKDLVGARPGAKPDLRLASLEQLAARLAALLMRLMAVLIVRSGLLAIVREIAPDTIPLVSALTIQRSALHAARVRHENAAIGARVDGPHPRRRPVLVSRLRLEGNRAACGKSDALAGRQPIALRAPSG